MARNYEKERLWAKNKYSRILADIDKDLAKELKDKLKNDGNEIIIITARDSEFHDDPYKYSKDWLDKNNIYYDKLVVNARNKKIACIEEKIDLFIDDSESNCLNVKKAEIKTIRVCNKIEENNSNLICFNNWNDIYSYIQTIK